MIDIAGRQVGPSHRVFLVAELSGNARTYQQAAQLVRAAHWAGADAVKCQTYAADSLTLACDNEYFQIEAGPWQGKTLYDLYREAAMPWEWQPELKALTESLGLVWFSTPFDKTAVDFLANLDVPCYKIASFEIVDLPLISYAASKGKPVIISTGMATIDEIWDAIDACWQGRGDHDYAFLVCTSAYPAGPSDANLQRLTYFQPYGIVVGLSDHSFGHTLPVAVVALGARIIEKHLCLDRSLGGPDAGFSLEPKEFKAMVEAVRDCETALGSVRFGPTESETPQLPFRRSLFAVVDIAAGETFTGENVRSIRPAAGLHPRYLAAVLGRKAKVAITRGTPLAWKLID